MDEYTAADYERDVAAAAQKMEWEVVIAIQGARIRELEEENERLREGQCVRQARLLNVVHNAILRGHDGVKEWGGNAPEDVQGIVDDAAVLHAKNKALRRVADAARQRHGGGITVPGDAPYALGQALDALEKTNGNH